MWFEGEKVKCPRCGKTGTFHLRIRGWNRYMEPIIKHESGRCYLRKKEFETAWINMMCTAQRSVEK